SVEAEPGMLEQVEERLANVDRLKRKHGGTIEAVLEHAERCRAEIARLENAESLAGELRERLQREREERRELAARLSAGRAEAAPRLETAVAAALAGLAMDGVRLEVRIVPLG